VHEKRDYRYVPTHKQVPAIDRLIIVGRRSPAVARSIE
jgi:hypothetical protein